MKMLASVKINGVKFDFDDPIWAQRGEIVEFTPNLLASRPDMKEFFQKNEVKNGHFVAFFRFFLILKKKIAYDESG